MKTKLLAVFGTLSFGLAAGCAPGVSEVRTVHLPPKPATCELDYVAVAWADLVGGHWQMLGTLSISDIGVKDALAPVYRKTLRPRACAMGGEAIALMLGTEETGDIGPKRSSKTYVVLRRSAPPSAPVPF